MDLQQLRSYTTPLRPGIMRFATHSGVPGGFAARSCSAEVASSADFGTSGVTHQEACGQYSLQSKTCEEFYCGDYLQSALFDFVTNGDALKPGSSEESLTTAQLQTEPCAVTPWSGPFYNSATTASAPAEGQPQCLVDLPDNGAVQHSTWGPPAERHQGTQVVKACDVPRVASSPDSAAPTSTQSQNLVLPTQNTCNSNNSHQSAAAPLKHRRDSVSEHTPCPWDSTTDTDTNGKSSMTRAGTSKVAVRSSRPRRRQAQPKEVKKAKKALAARKYREDKNMHMKLLEAENKQLADRVLQLEQQLADLTRSS